MIIKHDFTDRDWLLLLEDSRGNGKVVAYSVFPLEEEAIENQAIIVFNSYPIDIPDYITTEIMTYKDFKESYGNHMPLVNRITELNI